MIYTKCFSSPIHLWHTTTWRLRSPGLGGPRSCHRGERTGQGVQNLADVGLKSQGQGIQSPASSNSYLYDLYVIYIYVIIYIHVWLYLYSKINSGLFASIAGTSSHAALSLSARCVASCTEVTSVCAVRTNSDCLTAGKSPRGPQGAPRGPQRSCWAMNLANSYVYR